MIRILAEAVGKGLAAGLVGTAAMTISSTIEMNIRGRELSEVPAKAAGKVLGVQPRNPEGKKRFTNVVHWSYGTSWGVVRGLLAAAGVREPLASIAHFGFIWGTALWMLPSLDVAPKVTQWDPSEIGIDAFHHAVYAAATGLAYDFLDGR